MSIVSVESYSRWLRAAGWLDSLFLLDCVVKGTAKSAVKAITSRCDARYKARGSLAIGCFGPRLTCARCRAASAAQQHLQPRHTHYTQNTQLRGGSSGVQCSSAPPVYLCVRLSPQHSVDRPADVQQTHKTPPTHQTPHPS